RNTPLLLIAQIARGKIQCRLPFPQTLHRPRLILPGRNQLNLPLFRKERAMLDRFPDPFGGALDLFAEAKQEVRRESVAKGMPECAPSNLNARRREAVAKLKSEMHCPPTKEEIDECILVKHGTLEELAASSKYAYLVE